MKLNTKFRDVTSRLLPQPDVPISPISIVVPARNAGDTIGRMLDSVFAQTSEAWELVIVDDGSTDRTRAIVEAALVNYPIRIIDGPKQGVSAARNAGTDAARFDHVLYLDADDWIGQKFVELMGAALAANNSTAGVRCKWAYETPDGRTQPADDFGGSDLFAAAAAQCPFAVHACVINRELVQSVGGFDTDLVIGEDWDLWQRVGRAGAKLAFVSDVLAYYCLRADSVRHRDLERMHRDLLDVAQRGNRSDPRVPNPLEKYRDGMPADPTRNLEAETLAGTMAVAVPLGADLASLIPSHPADLTKDITGHQIAEALHQGVAFGSCALADEWFDLYPRHVDRITEMLEALAAWLQQPSLVRESLRVLEEIIAMSSDLAGRSVLGGTAMTVVDIAQGVHDVTCDASQCEQLVVAVNYGTSWIGYLRLPVLADVVPADMLSDVIGTELGPRLIRRSLSNPKLALALATRVPKGTTLRSLRDALLDTSWAPSSGSKQNVSQFARWSSRSAAFALVGRDLPVPSITPLGDFGGELDDSREIAQCTPILMYHRVASTGPVAFDDHRVTPDALEAQLNHLRSNGYYGITLEEWRRASALHRPLPGRAVLLTFDYGYTDFIENAWPILREYDFASTVFVVPDLVGKTSSPDERFGEPEPLMDWDQLRFLQRNGVDIASHSGEHFPASRLLPTVLLANEQQARARLQEELGRDVRSAAYPFGQHNQVVRATFRHAGYDLGFTTHMAAATVWDDPMAVPRIAIGMSTDLKTFQSALGDPSKVNPLRRGVRQARQLRSSRD